MEPSYHHIQVTVQTAEVLVKKPNFDFERREREKAKAAKKAEKALAKASKGHSAADAGDDRPADAGSERSSTD